jgi:mannosyltransferase
MVLVVYALVLAALVPVRPLWLDEVLQLVGTKPSNTVAEVIRYVPQNPGGVPLGYLVQHGFLALAGMSDAAARTPSVMFGLGTVLAVIVLARCLGVERPWVTGVVFAALPITLRYAVEARPYSQAVFLSVLSTLAFLWWVQRRGAGRLIAYALILITGLYSQPFTIFTAGAHVAWLAWERRWGEARRCATVVFLAALSFLPWLVYSRSGWTTTIQASEFRFAANWKMPLLLIRELTGAGYLGAALLLGLALVGYRAPADKPPRRSNRRLLLLLAVVPVAGGLLADAAFGYFLAIRQFLWVLPPLAILAGIGLDGMRKPAAVAACVALLAVSVAGATKYFRDGDEDWRAAARAAAGGPGCLLPIPADTMVLYETVLSGVEQKRCSNALPDRFTAAVSPYGNTADDLARLQRDGYRIVSQAPTGRVRVLHFCLETAPGCRTR